MRKTNCRNRIIPRKLKIMGYEKQTIVHGIWQETLNKRGK